MADGLQRLQSTLFNFAGEKFYGFLVFLFRKRFEFKNILINHSGPNEIDMTKKAYAVGVVKRST